MTDRLESYDSGLDQKSESYLNSKSSFARANNTESQYSSGAGIDFATISVADTIDNVPEIALHFPCCYSVHTNLTQCIQKG